MTAGLIELESALSCKYVAAEALKALNAVYKALHAANPRDPVAVMVRRGAAGSERAVGERMHGTKKQIAVWRCGQLRRAEHVTPCLALACQPCTKRAETHLQQT